jgi:glycine/D-amino acid oxidase-like deaminating enzyme
MSERTVLIVGGGIAGTATAWFLARRGARDVVLIERETRLGSHATAQNAAILRTSMPDEVTERLARESAEFLRAPPAGFAPAPLVDECGIVITSAQREGELDAWEQRLDARARRGVAAETDVERCSGARLREIAPHFAARGAARERRAWLLLREGRIDNAALMSAFERGARRAGVRFELGQRVRELLVERSADGSSPPRVRGVRLADGRALEAETTVIAAGGWAAELGRLAGSRVTLRPTRRHLLVTASDARVNPRWPVVWADEDAFYARPEGGGLMLCACDEVDVEPDRLVAVSEERERVLEKAARLLPEFAGARAARFWAGVRTLTHDDRFVIGGDADVDGLFWVAGLGGHGMTCSAAIGRLAADWIVDGSSAHFAAAHVDPARFARRAGATRPAAARR